LAFEDGFVTEYVGGWADYLRQTGRRTNEMRARLERGRKAARDGASAPDAAGSYQG
jgi:hypothetical protein